MAARAAKKLIYKEVFFPKIGPTRIRIALENWLWGDRKHLATRQLREWLASYLYLPRLKDADVLRRAIEDAIGGLVNDTFAYAEGFDEAAGRYIGLKLTGGGSAAIDSQALVVRRDVAAEQLAETERPTTPGAGATSPGGGIGPESQPGAGPAPASGPAPVRRYAASILLDPERPSRDMGRIAEEVIAHLSTLPNAKLRINVEIEAELPEGVPEDVQRTVLENGQTLKFRSQAFERD